MRGGSKETSKLQFKQPMRAYLITNEGEDTAGREDVMDSTASRRLKLEDTSTRKSVSCSLSCRLFKEIHAP